MLLGQNLVAPWAAVDWAHDAGWPWHSATSDSPGVPRQAAYPYEPPAMA